MKLVKQKQLFFQEGTSDKIYEIELYESGEGFLVNFRYGRRGGTLKEGTKTIFPVSRQEADKVFDSLEQEKRKKGYIEAGELQASTVNDRIPKKSPDKVRKAIIRILKAVAEGEEPENWPISRIIWRAGDLKISEAIPVINKILANGGDSFSVYSAIYAIGRCGNSNSIPFLNSIINNMAYPKFVTELAKDCKLKLVDEKERDEILDKIGTSIPDGLRESLNQNDYKEFEKQLNNYLFNLKTTSNDYLKSLYLLSLWDSNLAPVFYKILNKLPLKTNYFKQIRSIFKLAEMFEDEIAYGILCKNIDKYAAAYKSAAWMPSDQKKQTGFSNKTKLYLSRRINRFLNKYGSAETDSYTNLATGILLAFDDDNDFTEPYNTSVNNYIYNEQTRRYTVTEKVTYYDSYSGFNAFNFILYKNSGRYQKSDTIWKCVAPYKPGDTTPASREEAFPHLWNQEAEKIILILSKNNCQKVNDFAIKVYNANPEFEKKIDTENIIYFLKSRFIDNQKLGLELAKKKFNHSEPDKKLILALLNSNLPDAREQSQQWIEELRTSLFEDTEFLFQLIESPSVEAHNWLRTFLTTNKPDPGKIEILLIKIIALLLSLSIDNEEEEKYALLVGDTVTIVFNSSVKSINLNILKDFFSHKSQIIHSIGGKFLLNHQIKAEELPKEFLEILLNSDFITSRNIGIDLIAKFPDDLLLTMKNLLVSFCISEKQDVRNSVKPIIKRLAYKNSSFALELVELFVPVFLMKEKYEGLHTDLLNLITIQLEDYVGGIGKAKAMVLANSKFKGAQSLGAVVITSYLKDEEFSVSDITRLSNNPVASVRKFSWDYFKRNVDSIKEHKSEAIKITDSNWDDTRLFAFDYFRNHFNSQDWNTELLVSICDSTKEDVQEFGREMITKSFITEQGFEYLLKLSQHPVQKIQLFATSFLEKFAADNIEHIFNLKLYFLTLLSQVNKGKVAKARVMNFLKNEALKNEVVAQLAIEIFTRVSLSLAITEKEACINALYEIRKKFKDLPSSIVIKDYSDYKK